MKTFLLIATSLLLSACATSSQSILLGAGIGGGIGAGAGRLATKHFQGAAIGLLVGAGIGALAGHFVHSAQEKKPAEEATPAKPGDDDFPPLTKPKLRSMWVPDQVEGNKYIKGHYIYVIEDPGNWSLQ